MSTSKGIGIVEDVAFTQGGMGNQWTTISGVRYCTYWNTMTKDWEIGDLVKFDDVTESVFSNTPVVRQAKNIHKVAIPAGSITLQQFRATKRQEHQELAPHQDITVDYLGGECGISVVNGGFLLRLNNEIHRSEDFSRLELLLYAWAIENLQAHTRA